MNRLSYDYFCMVCTFLIACFCTVLQRKRIIFPYTTFLRCKKCVFRLLMNGDTAQKGGISMTKNITGSQRKAFCCFYAMLGSVAEAARRAGFPRESAVTDGIECLRSARCRREIEKLRELLTDRKGVISGLRRLAFGSCSDAVYLVFADELPPSDVIEGLDLYNVSEIKRVKGGGVEVKLFDRLRALEKLAELENTYSDSDKAAGLISALTAGEVNGSDDN